MQNKSLLSLRRFEKAYEVLENSPHVSAYLQRRTDQYQTLSDSFPLGGTSFFTPLAGLGAVDHLIQQNIQ